MFGFLKKKKDKDTKSTTSTPLSKVESTSLTIPPDQEIEQNYIELLEKLAVPEGARAGLLKQDIDTKWKMLQAHSDLMETEDERADKTAAYWLEKLYATGNTSDKLFKSMRQLKVVVNTANKQFLVEFLDGHGIVALSNHMSNHSGGDQVSQAIQLELLETLRGLMNNEMGMESALSVCGLIDSVVRCLDFNNLVVSRKIIEMLKRKKSG